MSGLSEDELKAIEARHEARGDEDISDFCAAERETQRQDWLDKDALISEVRRLRIELAEEREALTNATKALRDSRFGVDR